MFLNFIVALPEIVLLAGACALMIVDLFVKDERRRVSYWLAQLILLACALATLFVWAGTAGKLVVRVQRPVRRRRDGPHAQARGLCRGRGGARLLAPVPAGPRPAARRIPHAAAVRAARHDGDDERQQLPQRVPGAGAAVAVPVRDGGAQPRLGRLGRGGDEVLRPRRARLRPAAVRHVDDLRRHRHAVHHRGGAGRSRS